jgi:hypothetical protein
MDEPVQRIDRILGFAVADETLIRVDADEQEGGVFLQVNRFNPGDLHCGSVGSCPEGQARLDRALVC